MKSLADRLRMSLMLSAAATLVACAASPEPSWEIPLMEVAPFTVEDINAASMGRPLAIEENCGRHGCPAPIPVGKSGVVFEVTDTETPGVLKAYYRNADHLGGDALYNRLHALLKVFCGSEPTSKRDVVIITSGGPPLFLEREFSCEPTQTNGAAN